MSSGPSTFVLLSFYVVVSPMKKSSLMQTHYICWCLEPPYQSMLNTVASEKKNFLYGVS